MRDYSIDFDLRGSSEVYAIMMLARPPSTTPSPLCVLRTSICALIMSVLVQCSSSAPVSFSLSAIFGNGAVLQSNSNATVVWGFGQAGAKVQTRFTRHVLTTVVNADGVWRQRLPPTAAGGPVRLSFRSGSQELALDDVYFGDVFFCRCARELFCVLITLMGHQRWSNAASVLSIFFAVASQTWCSRCHSSLKVH
jgi:hypothetical protein